MLYPNFHDLAAFKGRKLAFKHPSHRSVKFAISGSHHSPFRGQGLEFDSVREYVIGDDIRSIDWRVTARMGLPHIKLFKEERERQLLICVDMNETMRFGTRNTFKSVQAARIAAILGWQGLASQDRVSACLFGDVAGGLQLFAPKRTKKSFCAMLKILTQPPAERHHTPLKDVFHHMAHHAHAGSLVYLISDFMDPYDSSYEIFIRRLSKKCDVIFIAVNDQADKEICEVGLLGFSTNSEKKILLNTAQAAGRKAYTNQWQENRRRLHEISSRFNIPVIELSTESDIQRELSLGIKCLSKRRKR